MTDQSEIEITSLINSLKDRNVDERIQAAERLSDLREEINNQWLDEGPEPVPAVRALIEALEDPEQLVRSQAANTLGLLGASAFSAIPALLQQAQADLATEARIDAIWAIRCIAQESGLGPYNAQAIPVLTDALLHDSREIRGAAAAALGSLVLPDPQGVVTTLEQVARSDEDSGVRAIARQASDKLSDASE